MSGPLMTSAIAIFGNQSFFYIARNASNDTFPPPLMQICQSGRIPFLQLGDTMDFFSVCPRLTDYRVATVGDMEGFFRGWFHTLNDTAIAREAFIASLFFANKASLSQTVAATSKDSARTIYSSPGLSIPVPHKSLPSTIIISILIGLQLAGLGYTAYYIYQVPTWSHALDAVAIARLGSSLNDSDLPRIREGAAANVRKLSKVDGLVGVENNNDGSGIRPARGAPGLVSRALASPKSKDENSGQGQSTEMTSF